MGVKYLNRYLVTNCKNDIVLTHMSECSNKVVVVDISIYMYKFQMTDSLIDNMYIMLSLFEKYNIIPIFVFDGKPPPEKRNMINKRYLARMNAESEYTHLCKQIETDSLSNDDKREITNTIHLLKRKCVYVSKENTDRVQELIASYGYSYCVAPNEADELCAAFVIHGVAWACLSEDMDMFVHGAPRVLRYLSLINNTFVLYNTQRILERLGMSQHEFMYLCILSGTDYDIECDNNINTLFELFYKYKKTASNVSLYEWLKNNTEVTLAEESVVNDIYTMFHTINPVCVNMVKTFKHTAHIKDAHKVRAMLEEEGFVYPIRPRS